MPVRSVGIRDIAEIEKISIKKVLSVSVNSHHAVHPQQQYYEILEADEFWTSVGKKSNRVWLIYAYRRETGEIVAFVWGKRNLKTSLALKQKLIDLGITYGSTVTDDWDSFVAAFNGENHLVGKQYTVYGNNCRLRHRIRRAFHKTCCFSKKVFNHLKAFDLAFFYINFGFV
jgi:IS1 family transposase